MISRGGREGGRPNNHFFITFYHGGGGELCVKQVIIWSYNAGAVEYRLIGGTLLKIPLGDFRGPFLK